MDYDHRGPEHCIQSDTLEENESGCLMMKVIIPIIAATFLVGCATSSPAPPPPPPVPAIIFDLETDKVIIQSEDSTTTESILTAAEEGCAIHNRKATEPINTRSECVNYGSYENCTAWGTAPCVHWDVTGRMISCIQHGQAPCISHSSSTYCEKSVNKTLFACIE